MHPHLQTWDSYYDDAASYVDYASDNLPAYGLQQVVITGKKLPDYTNFAVQDVNYAEFTKLAGISGDGGGGGGGGTSTANGCGNGKQLVNWGLIQGFEGSSLKGDVPLDANGHPASQSGVTIASGFDLGAHDTHDFQTLGFSAQLTNKLTPYIGLKGQAASDYAHAHPLTITDADATTINAASHAETLSKLVVAYDTRVGQAGAFYQLPSQAQTVIASLSFQYGDLSTKADHFWSDVVYQDWSAAVGELRQFFDAYPTRRNHEADLLQQAIDAKLLQPGKLCVGQ
jgi:hypothetical protein